VLAKFPFAAQIATDFSSTSFWMEFNFPQ
jgi:hypothetical protein